MNNFYAIYSPVADTLRSIEVETSSSIPEVLDVFQDIDLHTSAITQRVAATASELLSSSTTLNPMVTKDLLIIQVTTDSMPWIETLFIALLFGYYLYILYRYWHYIPTMLQTTFSLKKTMMVYQAKSNEQIELDWHSTLLAILALTTVVTRLIIESPIFAHIQQPLYILIPIILAVVGLLFLYKLAINRVYQLINSENTSISYVKIINRHTISLLALFFTPFAIIAALNSINFMLATALLLLFWLFYATRLWVTFIRAGFGNLQWLLYLCIVELLPISIIIAIAVRFQLS